MNKLDSLPKLPSKLKGLYCDGNNLTTLPNFPDTLIQVYLYQNPLPFFMLDEWKIFNRFRSTYYKLKFGPKLERYYIKNNKTELHQELIDTIYSPNYNFYKKFLNPDVVKMFN